MDVSDQIRPPVGWPQLGEVATSGTQPEGLPEPIPEEEPRPLGWWDRLRQAGIFLCCLVLVLATLAAVRTTVAALPTEDAPVSGESVPGDETGTVQSTQESGQTGQGEGVAAQESGLFLDLESDVTEQEQSLREAQAERDRAAMNQIGQVLTPPPDERSGAP